MNCKKCGNEIPDNSVFCMFCSFDQRKAVKSKKPKTRGNGTGTAYKRGKYWEAQYTCGKKISPKTGKLITDRRRKSGFLTKKEALEYIPIIAAKKIVTREVTTLVMFWDNYSNNAMQKLSKSKQTAYKIAYNKIESYSSVYDIVNMPIKDLTINHLQEMVNSVAATYYPARDIKNLLSHLYKRAMAQKDVMVNLANFIILPELEEEAPNPFNEDELKKLWNDYGKGNKFTAYILLMIYSGMMPGKLFRAEKNMVDWEKQQIIGCGLKTKKRKITPIIIADFIIPVVKEICDNAATEKLLSIGENNFYKEFHETLSRCEIEDRTPYACRHTTATALALGNIAPAIIQEVMRHTKFSTTQRYIHVDVDTAPMLDAVNKMK